MTGFLRPDAVALALLALSVAAAARPPAGRVAAAAATMAVVTALYRGPAPWVLYALVAELPLLALHAGRVARRAPVRAAALALGATAGALLVLPLRFTLADVADPLPVLGALVLGAGLVAVAAAPVGWQLYQRVLEDRREAAVAEARAEARLTLARGLHDLVAHEITGVVLEAQASQLSRAAGDPEALARIEQAGQRALASMDDLIAQLSGRAVAHRLADLHGLAERFATTGRATTTVTIADGLADALPPAGQALLYRCALEALTNVRRHAGLATHVALSVAPAGPDHVALTVTDDAPGAPAATPARPAGAGGTGLATLRDDLAHHGGTLSAEPGAGGAGWRLTARLPLAPGRPVGFDLPGRG